jgi:AcrR family transcriptional regulator
VPRVKERTPELRERVLGVAVTMLKDGGVPGFTARRVAAQAGTSTPAVYELFGDKGGLVREVFFEGFRMLRRRFDRLGETDDALADLRSVIESTRSFVRANPVLADVMFSRPFADFGPGPEEVAAGGSVREFIIGRVRRCVAAGLIVGNETDVAHVLLALTQGLAGQESAGWLGSSKSSIDRRWALAVTAALDGLGPVRPHRRGAAYSDRPSGDGHPDALG